MTYIIEMNINGTWKTWARYDQASCGINPKERAEMGLKIARNYGECRIVTEENQDEHSKDEHKPVKRLRGKPGSGPQEALRDIKTSPDHNDRHAEKAEEGGESMTREEMYKLLEKKHKETDWNNLQSIKAYNEYARMLRKLVDEE